MPDDIVVKAPSSVLNEAPRAHAFLSPSASKRWMACPAAPWEESKCPIEPAGKYAEEGTAAHLVAEGCAIRLLKGENIDSALSTVQGEELQYCMRTYLEEIAGTFFETPESWCVEHKVNLSKVFDVPDQFGTADCLLVSGGVLHVFDYKHGEGVMVSAEHNPQLMIYALGALKIPGAEDIEKVVLHIVQPRSPKGAPVSVWETTRTELEAFEEEVKTSARRVIEIRNAGKAEESDYAPSDETCRFCKAKKACSARAGEASAALGLPKKLPSPELADDKELAALLAYKGIVTDFFKDVEDEAFRRIRLGHEIIGFKLVEGNMGIRRWRDAEEAEEMIVRTMRIPQEFAYEKKLINPTRAEALNKKIKRQDGTQVIGDRQWAKLENLIVRNPGKPTLVSASDDRPALVFDISEDLEAAANGEAVSD